MKKIITITAVLLTVSSFNAFAAEKKATEQDQKAPVEQAEQTEDQAASKK